MTMQGENGNARFLKMHQGSVMGVSFHPKVGLTPSFPIVRNLDFLSQMQDTYKSI